MPSEKTDYLKQIEAYIERKNIRANATAKIKDGTMYILHKGKFITQEAFDLIYPKIENPYPIKINPDGRKI